MKICSRMSRRTSVGSDNGDEVRVLVWLVKFGSDTAKVASGASVVGGLVAVLGKGMGQKLISHSHPIPSLILWDGWDGG